MKILTFFLVFVAVVCSTSCDNNTSIKDNSSRLEKEEIEDFSGVASEDLYKFVVDHYDLNQFEKGKSKLSFLMEDRPDLIDSLGLVQLLEKFDKKLASIKVEVDGTDYMRSYIKNGVTYFEDKTTPKFDSKETFHAHYKKSKSGKVRMYLKIKYIDTKWLNINSYLITVDKLDYDLKGEITQLETKGKKKYKHETLDEPINTLAELEIIEAIANGKNIKAVYISEDGYKERVLTEEQIKAVGNVLNAYLFTIKKDITQLKESFATN